MSIALLPTATFAASLEECLRIDDKLERLSCYDQVHGRTPPRSAPLEQRAPRASTDKGLWEAHLDRISDEPSFGLRPHRPNYLLFSHVASRPRTFAGRTSPFQRNELKFQLSLQSKVWNGEDTDWWVAYTARSYWQVFNSDISRPFRETEHMPEVFASVRAPSRPLGLYDITYGFLHHSNGQGGAASRSWNRIYADARFVNGPWRFNLKPWIRVPENKASDDNPDIENYFGRYEVAATYAAQKHELGLVIRNPFSEDNRYAAELNWSIKIRNRLHALVQIYRGHGENLIDYDQRVERLGIGFVFSDL